METYELIKDYNKLFNCLSNNVLFFIFIGLFSLLFIFNISYCIYHCKNKNKHSFYIKICINDNIEKNLLDNKSKYNNTNNSNNENNNTENKIRTEIVIYSTYSTHIEINENEFKKTTANFIKIFKYNLKRYHPLIKCFHISFLFPIFLSIFFLILNIGNYIFFTVFFLSKEKINKIHIDKYSNKFYYPLTKEINTVFQTLALSIVIFIIIKLFLIFTINDFRKLQILIANEYTLINKIKALKLFFKKKFCKNIFICLLILIICLFYMYFSMLFYNMYYYIFNFWIWSVFWCLIFNYIIISPFIIFFTSILESMNETPKCIYYFYQIFPF